MTQSGIPVPEGFVVLSTTFDHFLKETDLVQEIDAILKTVDHKAIHTVDSASEKIRGLIESREVPDDIANEIMSDFEKLGAEFVAVRSSATAEDGAEHAWAGQLESFLNTDKNSLLDHVRKCWGSLFTPRAIFYRFEKDLSGTEISVAVVVQKMIQSEVSGIAFSVHPITEDYNQLIIEAGYGLGEAIVSGSITPDSYVVEKEPLQIIDQNIAEQKKALVKEGASNNWVMVDKEKREQQKLSGKEITELSKIIIQIEKHYGFPCDIEWALEGGKFYIVQSRPITTLAPKKELKTLINTEDYHFFGLWKCNLFSDWYWSKWLVPEYAKRIGLDLNDSGIFVINGGYFFTKKSVIETIREYANNIIESKDKEKLALLRKLTNEIYDTSLAVSEKISEAEPNEINVREMAESGQQIMFPWCFGYILSEVFDEFLIPAADKAGINREDISALIPPFKTPLIEAQDNLRLIKKVLEDKGHWNLLLEDSTKAINEIQKDEQVSKLIQEHSFKYGWTNIMNLVGEDPNIEQVIDQITHIPSQQTHITNSVADEDFEFLIQCASTTAYLRQTGVEYFSIYSRYAQKLLGLAANKIGITYRELLDLNLNEIIDGVNGKDVKEIVKRRANDNWAIYSMLNNEEPVVFDDPEVIKQLVSVMVPKAEASEDGTIKGQIGNKGSGKGKVKIILSLDDFHKMEPGAVLVTTMTTPDYVPLMQKASAIITDIGGLLCHAAIISRELNIPCVIGTKFATQLLKDDMEVEVDADNGVVRIIDGDNTNKESNLVGEISKLSWFKSWEAKFPMFLVTIGGPGYFKPMKEAFDFELGHFLVITREGILAGFWVEKELVAFGNHLTKFAENDPEILVKWSLRLKQETDECRALMSKGKDYFLNTEHFRELRRKDEVLSAYQVAVREVINYLPDDLREKYTPDLEGARKHSETIFFELGELVTSVLHDVAQKENISKDLIECLTGDELETYFDTNKLPDEKILKDRYKCSGFINHPEFSWLAEEDIKQIEKSFVENSSDEIKGQPAYGGKVTGRARVVKNFSAAGDFPRGEILVTGMTDPNYVPIMEKAGAIVTDAGGLLCHAAIVSREMKKPCIVGTKIATHLIKTGDMVEVDADNGIVRIL